MCEPNKLNLLPRYHSSNRKLLIHTTWSTWRRSWEKMPLDVGFLHLFLRLRNQDLGIPFLKALFIVFMFLSSTNFCSIQYGLRIIILIIFQVLRFSSFANFWTNYTSLPTWSKLASVCCLPLPLAHAWWHQLQHPTVLRHSLRTLAMVG